MDSNTLGDMEGRLSKIEGQVRGIRGMAADGRECVDVVAQIAAVRGALKKVADLMVANHVDAWFRQESFQDGNGHRGNLEDLLKVFSQYYR